MGERTVRCGVWLLVVLVAGLPEQARAQPATSEVARSEAAAAAVTRRKPDGTYESYPAKAPLAAEELLVLLPGASLINTKNTVRLTSRADFEGNSPLPILDTAVELHKHDLYDLDFTLDRGRVELESLSKGGERVLVRFHRQRWLLTLQSKGTKVAIELSGRWAPGTRYLDKPPLSHEPVASAVVLVLKGDVEVDTNESTFVLTAPPGPAMLAWESTAGLPRAALRLEKLPDWANSETALSPTTAEYRAAVDKIRRLLADQPAAAIDIMLASEHESDRRVGYITAGAFDDLDRLSKAEATDPATIDFGVSVMRHWLGRGPGQPQRLYTFLTKEMSYKPGQAETLIALLNGFSREELQRPETYEVLVEYLRHERPVIRAMAAWHLVRLVPAGKDIPFPTKNGKGEPDLVYKKWKDLIPSGRLPPGVRK